MTRFETVRQPDTRPRLVGSSFVCATAFQLHSILGMKLKDEGIQVLRKLISLDNETRQLVEVFDMAENKEFPEVDTEKFK